MNSESLMEQSISALHEKNTERAAVLARLAEVAAYNERTRMMGEVTGWKATGTYDQYVQKVENGLESVASAINNLASATESK